LRHHRPGPEGDGRLPPGPGGGAVPAQMTRAIVGADAGSAEGARESLRGFAIRARGIARDRETEATPAASATRLSGGPMSLESKLSSLGINLPTVPGPFGAYVPAKRSGNLVFVAGQLPMKDGKLIAIGQVPS